MANKKIVTKDSLRSMLQNENPEYVKAVVGRALVAIFRRQTDMEQASNGTSVDNGIGFAGCDAYSGSLTAKSFMKNKTLQDWQVEKWLKVSKNGYPRLCKYSEQLNEIAILKVTNP